MTSDAASFRYRFGHFELQPAERRLLADGIAVHIGPHALDVLVALVEGAGRLVTKDELLARVWGRVVVEENTLQVHVAMLRKVLGANAIATVSGHGYRFAPEVARVADSPSEGSAAPRKHNLPLQLTSFIGRGTQINEIRQLISCSRMVTLTGAGGCGKTRLALRVAEDVVGNYADGVWLVELAPLVEPTHVARAVASALGITEQAGKEMADTLAETLLSRHMLLLLDNAEHLLNACAQLAHALLRRCARLGVVVTSRERLGIAGEVTYRVPSLSVPDDDHTAATGEVLACEAARLFIERARLQRPDFDVTTRDAAALGSICRRLDGIALAIELAAPRVRTMSLEELSRRIDRRFTLLTGGSRTALPRHRTLRSLIDWSYDLLTEAERTLLQRASVFAGGWTLQAAEVVCSGEGIDCAEVLDLLTSLTDKSLVAAETEGGETRFAMLETVRDYALDQLRGGDGEAAIRARHVEYFRDVAEKLAEEQHDSDRQLKLSRLDREHDNLRAALSWSEGTATCSHSGLRLAGKLYWFWRARGFFGEGRNWVYRLLAAAADGGPEKDRATALTTAGVLAAMQGDYRPAVEHWEDALLIRRRHGEQRHVAVLLKNLGSMALIPREREQHEKARVLYEEAMSIFRELGDRKDIGGMLYCLGVLSVVLNDYVAARSLLEESLSMRREFGIWHAAETLVDLGKVEYLLGDNRSARSRLMEALAGEREFGHRQGIAKALVWLGIVSHDEGNVRLARTHLGEALEILQVITDRQTIGTALEAIAGLCLESSSAADGACLLGHAQHLRDEFDAVRTEFEVQRYERMRAALRAGLNDDVAFDRAWQKGRSLTMDEAFRLAAKHLEEP